jgi:acetyl esterase/lipase
MTRPTPIRAAVACALALLVAGCTGPRLAPDALLEEDVVYAERDSGDLYGRLFTPGGSGPHPGVLLVHGGGWRGGKPWHMDHIGRMLANQGFVAYSASYRFSPDHPFPSQLEDVRDAYAWLQGREDVDAENVAVWGYSAGAHLALLLALAPDAEGGTGDLPRPIAVVGGGSPTRLDLFDPDGRLLVDLLGGSLEDHPEQWETASPITWASADDPPTYLYHGTIDAVVDIEHAQQLADALQDEGVPAVLDTVIGGHISVAVFDRNVERRAAEFIRQHLKDDSGMFDGPFDDDVPAAPETR